MNFIRYKPATRIGNWLYQIAFAHILGSTSVAFYVPPGISCSLLEKCHEMYPDVSFVTELPTTVEEYDEKQLAADDFRLPVQRDNLLLCGYFQYPQLFSREKVIAYFKCPDRIQLLMHDKYPCLFSCQPTVGISVRRGDYLKLPHRHPFVGKAYLRRAVTSFPKGYTYLVCSDDFPWCKKFFSESNFPDRHFIFVEEDVLTQLFVQAFCHHNILSNSTFSWWGAYLNSNADARILFPSMWYGMQNRNDDNYLYNMPGAEIIHNGYSFCQWCHAVALCCKNKIGGLLRELNLRRSNRSERIPDSFFTGD